MEIKDLKVLIVDDVSAPRRVLKVLLSKLGINNVAISTSGKGAMEYLSEHLNKLDLIICDYNLGDITGVDILHYMRANPRLKKIPFIMITSDVLREDFEEAKKAGVSAYLLKPFSLHNLSDIINSAFQKHGVTLSEQNDDAFVG